MWGLSGSLAKTGRVDEPSQDPQHLVTRSACDLLSRHALCSRERQTGRGMERVRQRQRETEVPCSSCKGACSYHLKFRIRVFSIILLRKLISITTHMCQLENPCVCN